VEQVYVAVCERLWRLLPNVVGHGSLRVWVLVFAYTEFIRLREARPRDSHDPLVRMLADSREAEANTIFSLDPSLSEGNLALWMLRQPCRSSWNEMNLAFSMYSEHLTAQRVNRLKLLEEAHVSAMLAPAAKRRQGAA